MKNDYSTIEAYLTDAMSTEERENFESLLKTNSDFQKTYIKYYLENEPIVDEVQLENRRLIVEARQRLGNPSKPNLRWLDHFRFFFSQILHLQILIAALIITIILIPLWVNMNLPSTSQLIQDYFVDPPNLGFAGNGDKIQQSYETFIQASDIYWSRSNNQTELLRQLAKDCASFCMAHYYMAHLAYKENDFVNSQYGFEQCLSNQDYIIQFSQTRDLDKIRFNLILSRIAVNRNEKDVSVRTSLETLINNKNTSNEVLKSALELEKKLNHPLRFLLLE